MSNKSLFTNNNTLSSLFTNNNNNNTSLYFNAYTKLDYYLNSSVFTKIQNILIQYSLGNFDYVVNNLTTNDYAELSSQLYNLNTYRADDYTQNNKVLQFYKYALQGLYQCTIQTINLRNANNTILVDQQRLSVLDNYDELLEYLKKLNKLYAFLPEQNIVVAPVKLKPQYTEYIRLYGFPEGCVFDVNKLSAINNPR